MNTKINFFFNSTTFYQMINFRLFREDAIMRLDRMSLVRKFIGQLLSR